MKMQPILPLLLATFSLLAGGLRRVSLVMGRPRGDLPNVENGELKLSGPSRLRLMVRGNTAPLEQESVSAKMNRWRTSDGCGVSNNSAPR